MYSDVDLCLTTSWVDPVNGISNMNVLSSCLLKCNQIILRDYLLIPLCVDGMEDMYVVANAKVPIVKFYDPEFNLACMTHTTS